MKVTTPSDRVQLIGQGQLMAPGCCALCGTGNSDDGYVDTGIWYEYEGQVYLCWTCAHQIASVIGCLSAEETVHLQGLLNDAATELASVKAELEVNNERLANYDALVLGAIIGSDSGPVEPSSSPASDEPEESEPESALSSGSVTSPDSGEPVVKEPVKGSGRRKSPRTERSDSDPSGFEL